MAVRAKVRCTARKEFTMQKFVKGSDDREIVEHVEVTLLPVYGGEEDAENREWSKWTPSGEIRLTITNPAAFQQFKIGRGYFVDFTPADE